MMTAVVGERYGPPESLRLRRVERPVVGDDQILVRVRAASINPFDWHVMRGEPYIVRLMVGLRRPKGGGFLGVDVAGTVEAVGRRVTEFEPGDEAFGSCSATFAEYTTARERNLVGKPPTLGFEEAAALPGAGVTALQAVRDHGRVQEGQSVLINGAAGGVGTFAVQIAKALGARVTGVCSPGNAELVRSLGAAAVVDYSAQDFTRTGARYDVIVDNVGNHSLRALRRALEPDGTLVVVGGGGGRLVGGLPRKLGARLMGRVVDQRMVSFIANVNRDDIAALADLVEAGKVRPVVERTYPLTAAPHAIRHVETGHARGKVVLTV